MTFKQYKKSQKIHWFSTVVDHPNDFMCTNFKMYTHIYPEKQHRKVAHAPHTYNQCGSLLCRANIWCTLLLCRAKETPKIRVSNIEDYAVLKDFEDVFKEIPILTPKRDIDFSINLMPEATPVSKTPYRMSTPELKEFQMQLEEIIKKGYICPSVSPWGALVLFVKKKDGTLRLFIDFR
jgi:hypothetical protein